MKNLLIISFDLIRDGEPETSLAIASIISNLKQDKEFEQSFTVSHISFNMIDPHNLLTCGQIIEAIKDKHDLGDIEFIAISCYVWSEFLTNPLIQSLRKNNYKNKIILGGYQISYANDSRLQKTYPDCQFFIKGYAEESLHSLLLSKTNEDKILNQEPDFQTLPSPYLTNEIPVDMNQKMVRFETKRGCPYRCSFCGHRDLQRNKVYSRFSERINNELLYFKNKEVKKINVVDPVFNMGNKYLDVLEKMVDLEITSLISIQARIENIRGENGEKFIDLCSKLNCHLEIGLQTIHENELKEINRRNNLPLLKETLNKLNHSGVSFEASLIYGLPYQTVDTFKESIEFLQENQCATIKAFPLMLLRGTELYSQRNKWNFKEEVIGEYNIPVVTSSNSFNKDQWKLMREMANSLEPNNRF